MANLQLSSAFNESLINVTDSLLSTETDSVISNNLNFFESILKYTIIWLCFIFGIPGNILTIILCLRSLIKFYKKRKTKNLNNVTRYSLKNVANFGDGRIKRVSFKSNTTLNENNKIKYSTSTKTTKQHSINYQNSSTHRTFELYLIEISIFDLLMLIYWLFDELIDYVYSKSLINLTQLFCKLFIYINRINGLMCMWLILIITLIRCIFISKPLYSRKNFYFRLNTIKSNIIVLCVFLSIFCISNFYVFTHFELKSFLYNKANSTLMCEITNSNNYSVDAKTVVMYQCMPKAPNNMLRNLNNIGIGILGYCLPSILILLINFFIIYEVLNSYYKLNHTDSFNVNYKNNIESACNDENRGLNQIKIESQLESSYADTDTDPYVLGSYICLSNAANRNMYTSTVTTNNYHTNGRCSSIDALKRTISSPNYYDDYYKNFRDLSIDKNVNEINFQINYMLSKGNDRVSNGSIPLTINEKKCKYENFQSKTSLISRSKSQNRSHRVVQNNKPTNMQVIRKKFKKKLISSLKRGGSLPVKMSSSAINTDIEVYQQQLSEQKQRPKSMQLKYKQNQRRNSNSMNYYKRKQKRNNNNIFNYLLAVSLSYIICYLPYSLAYLLNEFECLQMISHKITYFGYYIRYISHSITFYAYILTGKRFRNDFFRLIRSLFDNLKRLFFCFKFQDTETHGHDCCKTHFDLHKRSNQTTDNKRDKVQSIRFISNLNCHRLANHYYYNHNTKKLDKQCGNDDVAV